MNSSTSLNSPFFAQGSNNIQKAHTRLALFQEHHYMRDI